MAGKTALAQLLENQLLLQNELRVIRISSLWMGGDETDWSFSMEFERLMGGLTWIEFQKECQIKQTVLIIDEAQVSI